MDDQVMLAGMSGLLADGVAARRDHPVSLPGINAWVRLTGSKLETLIDSMLRTTVASLRAVMSAAALTPADIGTILTVGGCARIPQVAQLLDTELGRAAPLRSNLVNVIGVLGVESVGERARTCDLLRVDRPRVDRHGATLEEHLDVGGH